MSSNLLFYCSFIDRSSSDFYLPCMKMVILNFPIKELIDNNELSDVIRWISVQVDSTAIIKKLFEIYGQQNENVKNS